MSVGADVKMNLDPSPPTKLDAELALDEEFLQWCKSHNIDAEVMNWSSGLQVRIKGSVFHQDYEDVEYEFRDISKKCNFEGAGPLRWATYSWHIKAEALPVLQQVRSVLPRFSMQELCTMPEGSELPVKIRHEDDDYTEDDFDISEVDTDLEDDFAWSDDEDNPNLTYLNTFDPPLRKYNPHMVEWKRNCGDKATRLSIEGRSRILRNIPATVIFPIELLLIHKDAIQDVLLKHFGPDSPS